MYIVNTTGILYWRFFRNIVFVDHDVAQGSPIQYQSTLVIYLKYFKVIVSSEWYQFYCASWVDFLFSIVNKSQAASEGFSRDEFTIASLGFDSW
jgi:hypothetical protein